MFKITPNPPVSIDPGIIDPQAADRALAHYNLPEGSALKRSSARAAQCQVPAAQSREEALVNASSILESAAATLMKTPITSRVPTVRWVWVWFI